MASLGSCYHVSWVLQLQIFRIQAFKNILQNSKRPSIGISGLDTDNHKTKICRKHDNNQCISIQKLIQLPQIARYTPNQIVPRLSAVSGEIVPSFCRPFIEKGGVYVVYVVFWSSQHELLLVCPP